MENKDKNEEVQSRREFFKQAAKSALPILGAVVLASTPILSVASEKEETGCSGVCSFGCSRACSYGCSNSCAGTCSGACKGGCQGSCTGSCSFGCRGWNR